MQKPKSSVSTASCPLKQDFCSDRNIYYDIWVTLDAKSSCDALMPADHNVPVFNGC